METTEMEEDPTEKWIRENCQDFSSIQDENGIDLQHLRENLALTPLERLRRKERAIHALYKIRLLNKKLFTNKS
jgi:hypothetical protein